MSETKIPYSTNSKGPGLFNNLSFKSPAKRAFFNFLACSCNDGATFESVEKIFFIKLLTKIIIL